MEHMSAYEMAESTTWSSRLLGYFDSMPELDQVCYVLIPSAICILWTWAYANSVRKSPKVAKSGNLFRAKLVFGAILIAVRTSEAAAMESSPTLHDALGLSTGPVSCVATICAVLALFTEHFYCYHSAVLLSVYLAITILLDIARVHSFYLRGFTSTDAIAAVGVGAKLGLMILEEVSKRSLFLNKEKQKTMSRASVAGFWGRTFVTWLNTTLLRGFRTPLTLEDIDDLDGDLQPEQVAQAFQEHWNKNPTARFAVVLTCFKTCGFSLVAVSQISMLVLVAARVAHVFLVKMIVSAVDSEKGMKSDTGNRIIATTVAVYGFILASRIVFHSCVARGTTMIRTGVISAIYDKVLDLDGSDATKKTAFALLTTDIQGVQHVVRKMAYSTYGTLSITSGIVWLWFGLGPQTVLSITPIILLCLASGSLYARVMRRFREWNSRTEDRVDVTRNLLTNIKSLRMAGLTPVFTQQIRERFAEEVEASKRYRHVHSLLWSFELITLALTPILILYGGLFWCERNTHISKADIFAALNAAILIAEPGGAIVHNFASAARVLACNDRIQEFFLRPPHVDSRESVGQTPLTTGRVTSSNPCEDVSADVQHVYTRPTTDGRQILQDVHSYFPPQKLTMVLGSVGSGKSTLLKVLIGQVSIAQGRTFVNSDKVGYCGQNAWIRNEPVKSCIIGPAEVCETWYGKVIRACCLDTDFQAWPKGDATIAGNHGENLSGGQKHRVALARSLYSRKPILVLDDLFSSLDKETTDSIFKNVFGSKGLLREIGSTAILATNLIEYVKYADVVLQFNEEGTLGRVDKTSGLIPARHLGMFGGTSGQEETQDHSASQENAVITQAAFNRRPNSHFVPRMPEGLISGNKTKISLDATDARLWKREGVYRFYLSSFGKWAIFFWVVWIAISEVLFKASTIYLRFWFQIDESDQDYFIGYVAVAVGSVISSALSIWAYFYFLVPRSYERLHNHLLASTIGATTHFFSTTDTGSLLNRFGQDMFLISQDLPFTLMYFLMFFFAAATVVVIIVSEVTYIAAVVPIFIFFAVGVLIFYVRTSRQIHLLQIDGMAPVYTLVDETTTGIDEIRAFQWQPFMKKECLSFLNLANKPFYVGLSTEQWLQINMDLSVLIFATLVVLLAVKFPWTTSVNGIGLVMNSMFGLSKEVKFSISFWAEVEAYIGAVARILSFEETTPQEPGPPPKSKKVPESWPQHGKIVLKKVEARFDSSEPNTPTVLRNVNTVIEPSLKVGVVGRSGSGKSSLLMTLLHMLHYDGTIEIDGVELRNVEPEVVRARITSIPQDASLLAGSVRHNLHPLLDRPGVKVSNIDNAISGSKSPDGSSPACSPTSPAEIAAPELPGQKREIKDADLISVLRRLQLWEHVEKYGGLSQDVNNLELSDGQRKLLTLGRGMVHHLYTGSKIALMDEVTNQVDFDTEQYIHQAIKEVFKGCTVLMVAHREGLLQDADFILELADGKVVEKFPNRDNIPMYMLGPSWGTGAPKATTGSQRENKVVFEAREPLFTSEERDARALEDNWNRHRQQNVVTTQFLPRQSVQGSPTGTVCLASDETSSAAPEEYEQEQEQAVSDTSEAYSSVGSEARALEQELKWVAEMRKTDEDLARHQELADASSAKSAAASSSQKSDSSGNYKLFPTLDTVTKSSAQPDVASLSKVSNSHGYYDPFSSKEGEQPATQVHPVAASKSKMPSSHGYYDPFSGQQEPPAVPAQPAQPVVTSKSDTYASHGYYTLFSSQEEEDRAMQTQQDNPVGAEPAVKGKGKGKGKKKAKERQ